MRESLERLYDGLCAAYGRRPLVPPREMNRRVLSVTDMTAGEQLPAHLAVCPDNEVIDFIAAVFQVSTEIVESSRGPELGEEFGALINRIFEEEGIGYRWVAGQIIRFDEPVTHDHAIKPAIELLHDGAFGAANDEFAAALEAYRAGRWRDAITNANAAFESTLKIRTGKPNLVAGDLIREARKQGVIPVYLADAVEHLEKLMHAVPAVRGQEGPHGLGDRPPAADQHLAQLVISLAASFILFMGRSPDTP
jgi:hypothetical protein